ncbi:MAG: cation:proton antiporter [Vicinamibacterales bacterium]
MHDLPILVTVVIALAYALVGGALAKRVGLSPLVGYLLAGIAVGPSTPGIVADPDAVGELAELGVMFLMFGVGLHFSLGDLWQVRSVAIPGAVLQILLSAGLGYLLTQGWGWTTGASLILGLAVSVASTVVLLRALTDDALLDSIHGRVAVGWLVVQDLATVVILVLLPVVVSDSPSGGAMVAAIAIGKAALFIALMLVAGTRVVPWLLDRVVRLSSRELFIVTSLTLAVGTALLSAAWFGVSLALGAFIAGLVVGESPYHHQVGADLTPFREAFQVLFFVSVGMLVNPHYLAAHWREVLALSALVIVGNGAIGAGLGFLLPCRARTALIVGAGLSQIGEFSFIVGQSGMALGLLDSSQYSLILAASLVSITMNTFVFKLIAPAERALLRTPRLRQWFDRQGPALPPTPLSRRNHVVIIGSGRVGTHIAEVLGSLGVERLVIESQSEAIDALARQGVPTLFGDAANSELLSHAGLEHARALIVTVPDESVAAIAVASARARAPHLHIVARASTRDGGRHLSALGANEIVRPEFEGSVQVLRRTLLHLGFPTRRIQEYVDVIRRDEFAPAPNDARASFLQRLAATDLDLEWIAVAGTSPVVGLSIAAASLRPRAGVSIVAVDRVGQITSAPSPDLVLEAGDEVAIVGTAPQIDAARRLIAPAVAPTAP